MIRDIKYLLILWRNMLKYVHGLNVDTRRKKWFAAFHVYKFRIVNHYLYSNSSKMFNFLEKQKNVLPSSTFFYEECSTVATIMIGNLLDIKNIFQFTLLTLTLYRNSNVVSDQSLQNYVLQTSKQQNSTAARK